MTADFAAAQLQPVLTWIPSEAGGSEGICTLIKIPSTARYGSEGAPVAIYMPGGFDGVGIGDKDAGLVENGFIEISFNFPGMGTGDKQSGGVYDNRGVVSLRAVCDVIRFALGDLTDLSEKTLSDIVSPIVPVYTNVGLIGYSNGGNTNICVAGIHGDEISDLAWILNWESPVGDGMPQAEAGAKKEGKLRPLNPEINFAYDPTTGNWDLSTLTYDSKIKIPILDDINNEVTGGLFFDFNQDQMVDPGSDFIPYPLVFSTENGYRAYYSERLREEAEEKNLFPYPLPSHVPGRGETDIFWAIRNGEYWIDSTLQKISHLMFMVVASEVDHVQRAPDHPHVLIQYEGFRTGGARFVRLNPDRVYVEKLLGRSESKVVDNDAFTPFDHMSIRDAVSPGAFNEVLGRDLLVPAGACELADRTHTCNLDPQLNDVLTFVKITSSVPIDFQLFQNYPNPFNNRTVIRFSIYQRCPVLLEVFNLFGQRIATLVRETLQAGNYQKTFDPAGLSSGIYICHIRMGEYSAVKKMELIK